MKKRIFIFAVVSGFIFSSPIHADWKESLRPHMTKILGEKWSSKILGINNNDQIELPFIPEVKKSAKSIAKNCSLPGSKTLSKDKMKKYNYLFIKEIFVSTRNSKPNENDLAIWLNTLNQGATREGVYRAMVLDNTYAGLESQDNETSDRSVDFAAKFMSRYLNQTATKEALKGTQFYTLKRIVAERTLELVDVLCQKPEDLQKWYAVFSSEMARDYPGIWSKELRRNKDASFHYQWAKAVPEQFIKSEVMIKVHRIFNSLI